MTQKTWDALWRAAQWAALAVSALGGAWSMAKAVGATKVDVTRFERDSVARDYREVWRDTILLRVDARVRAIYCAGKPAGCQ